MPTRHDENEIISYLLGAPPEAEVERLDELSVADDEFADALNAAENDLIDRYVGGELSGEMLERFNDHYLASPQRRHKVQFARSLVTAGNEYAAGWSGAAGERVDSAPSPRPEETREKTPGKSPRRSWLRALLAPRLDWGFAALAVLLIVIGGYVLRENHRLAVRLEQDQAQRAGLEETERKLERQLAEQTTLDADAARSLARMREQIEQLESEAASHPESPTVPAGKMAAFTLMAPIRGLGQPPAIDIPAGTDFVVLNLELDAADLRTYQAVIKDSATRQVIWHSGKVKPVTKDAKKIVALRLAARKLRPRNYAIDLSGLGPDGDWEIVGTYPLRVTTH
ncbi:MAG TPA: hypothetical protein VI756_06975 [Blastocatellia bacterium]